jgi:geranylgeranyl reductase family protein
VKGSGVTFIANKHVYYKLRRTAVIKVAIVGAGPAGSYCAYKLAEDGIYPSIFDYSHPREKPCGGLIPIAAQELFPFIKALPITHSERSAMNLISPSGRRRTIHFRRGKIIGFSRLKFDQYLLNMAVKEGADLIEEKVVGLERKRGWWKVGTQKHSYDVETLVGADGVNSMVRRNIIGSLSKRDKGVCFGYFVKGLENGDITIKFLPAKKGYMWIIPRGEDTSIGVGSAEIHHPHELKKELDPFISEFCPQAEKISEWTALIPNVKDAKTFRTPIAGSNWILIGDAAGHVDPISGSGIIYALSDGELAAEVIVKDHPDLFNKLWIETYGQPLLRDTMLRGWVYKRPLLELYCIHLKFQSAMPFV